MFNCVITTLSVNLSWAILLSNPYSRSITLQAWNKIPYAIGDMWTSLEHMFCMYSYNFALCMPIGNCFLVYSRLVILWRCRFIFTCQNCMVKIFLHTLKNYEICSYIGNLYSRSCLTLMLLRKQTKGHKVLSLNKRFKRNWPIDSVTAATILKWNILYPALLKPGARIIWSTLNLYVPYNLCLLQEENNNPCSERNIADRKEKKKSSIKYSQFEMKQNRFNFRQMS